jgi:hypothetical protein
MSEPETEKIKIVPNPEVVVEEETTSKPKFPTKLVRNVLIGAAGAAITGYVVCKLRNKEEDEDSDSETPWVAMFVPESTPEAASE